MQNQINTKHSSNPEDIFKSAKNVLEKRNRKEDSSKTTISKVPGKFSNRKKLQSNNTTFCNTNISLENPVVKWEAKYLRERKVQGKNTNSVGYL